MCCCYIIITGRSLVWFIFSLTASMLIIHSIITPKWLIGPENYKVTVANFTIIQRPSVGIYTRCTMMERFGYHCGPFDRDGFFTDNQIYPDEWKASMFFISLGYFIQSITVILTLMSFCRQSIFGKSIHTITGSSQVIAGIFVMIALFIYPFAWGSKRMKLLCGPEAEPFFPSECEIGMEIYITISSIFLCFLCGAISLKAESSNMRSHVKHRIEERGERFICIP